MQFAASIARHDGKGEYQCITNGWGVLAVAHLLCDGHHGFYVVVIGQMDSAGDVRPSGEGGGGVGVNATKGHECVKTRA